MEPVSDIEFNSLGFDELQRKLEHILPSGDTKEAALGTLEKTKAYARMSLDGE